MKLFLNKLLVFLSVLVSPIKSYLNKIKKAKAEKQLELDKKKSIEDLKKDFETRFHTNIDALKKTMGNAKQTDSSYHNDKLIEARKFMIQNNIQPAKGSQMTDIDLMNEHNEKGGYGNQSLKDVIVKEGEITKKTLNGEFEKERQVKTKLRWITRD